MRLSFWLLLLGTRRCRHDRLLVAPCGKTRGCGVDYVQPRFLIWRHAGKVRTAYGAYGRSEIVEGRDLTAVKYLIGTGGALTRLGMGREILGTIRHDPRRQKLLPAPDTKVLLDNHYIMATAGVLSRYDKEAARKLLLESLD